MNELYIIMTSAKDFLKNGLKKIIFGCIGRDNAANRDSWVSERLKEIPKGKRILDAGAGECKYKPYCSHLDYVSQDFNQYTGTGNGKGIQTGKWTLAALI